MPNAVTWVEIQVESFTRAKQFYERVFALEIEPGPDAGKKYGTFPYEIGAGGGCSIVEFEDYHPCLNGSLVYLNGGDDLGIPLSRVEAAGGKVIMGKTCNDEFGFIARFLDSEGNLISLHSWE
jgi:uncharacterized protein